MEDYTLGNVEGEFANICWANAPLTTNHLIKLCEEQLQWKRTTTYTVLKKFIKRGILTNQNGTVIVLITKDEFFAKQSEAYVNKSFNGSLPVFLTAFASRKKLNRDEIRALKKMIESYEEDNSETRFN